MRCLQQLAAAALAGVCFLATACNEDGSSGPSAGSCQEQEAIGYKELEAAARSALAEVDFSLARIGACEDTGKPWTRVQATVRGWPNRGVANRYFEKLGWSAGNSEFTSPDGAYRASNSTARDQGVSPTPFVTVTFYEVADQAVYANN